MCEGAQQSCALIQLCQGSCSVRLSFPVPISHKSLIARSAYKRVLFLRVNQIENKSLSTPPNIQSSQKILFDHYPWYTLGGESGYPVYMETSLVSEKILGWVWYTKMTSEIIWIIVMKWEKGIWLVNINESPNRYPTPNRFSNQISNSN